MYINFKLLVALVLLIVALFAAPPAADAKSDNYDRIVQHLKTKYQAKKVKIPMMWLARFAVKMARPAGFKSFSLTTFENLKFSGETIDAEMQAALRNAMGDEWSSILRVRSQKGSQAYLYMRETKTSIKIMLVTVDKNTAAVIRAAFNPDKLADFVNNPKILGISLDDDDEKGKQRTN